MRLLSLGVELSKKKKNVLDRQYARERKLGKPLFYQANSEVMFHIITVESLVHIKWGKLLI